MSNGASSRSSHPTIIQSVARASQILARVAAQDDGLTASEVAQAMDLSLPTTYHLLTTLATEGLLYKDSGRRYVLGPAAEFIADAVNRNLAIPDYYKGPLQRLAAQTSETAYLSAWRRSKVQILAIVEGSQAVSVVGLAAGAVGNEHARATGKLLLAHARSEIRDEVLGADPFAPLTEHTTTARIELEAEFERILQQGFAVDREEFAPGVSCLAVPIRSQSVVVAALTVSAPSDRFDRNFDQYMEAALSASESAALGIP
ncbi:IclR family transcriptional regulator [Prauserella endophytica]|uniref:IclR family transcriptional regulator n=1 Tax=Prauserella endophytica TaxID=1592324 RepID=A0ABY2S708_9PSEU|nr:IclR family transcriptional regulator [Prauserella endophytica]TKG71692.1 IclR family transcriptional regulator [Prauserella endophytica]